MQWKAVTYENSSSHLPSERWGHRLVLTNTNELVLFGGFGGSSADGKYLEDLWTFSTESCTWRPLVTGGQVPESRSNYTVHYDSVSDSIILYGGGSNNRMRYNSVCILDWKTKQWTQCVPEEAAEAPWERTYHISEFCYPYLIVHGGEGVANLDLDDMWAFSIIDRRWRELKFQQNEEAPRKRRFHSSALAGKYLYIMGGCTGNFHLLGDMYRVNLATLFQKHSYSGFRWETVTKKNKLLQRWGHSSEVYHNKIYISCGRISAAADTNDTFTYDSATETFEKLEVNSTEVVPRRRHASVIVGNCLLLFGGYNGKYLNDFHYLPLKAQISAGNCNLQRIVIDSIENLQQALMEEQKNCDSDLVIQIKENKQSVFSIKTNKNKLINNKFMKYMLQYSSYNPISMELPEFCDANIFRAVHLGMVENKIIICNKFSREYIINLVQANQYFVCNQANKSIEDYLIQALNEDNCMQILQLSSYFGFENSQKSAAEFYLIHHHENFDQKFMSFQKMMQHHIHLQVGSPEQCSQDSREKVRQSTNVLQEVYSHMKFELKQMKLKQQGSNFLQKAARHLKIALRRTSSKQDQVPSAKLKRNSSEKQLGCFARLRKFISGVLMSARVHHEASHQA